MVNSLSAGNSVMGACEAHGISLFTHYRWCGLGVEARKRGKFDMHRRYYEETRRAKGGCVDACLTVAYNSIVVDGNTNILPWFLSKIEPKRFGEKLSITVRTLEDQRAELFQVLKAGLITKYGEGPGLDIYADLCTFALQWNRSEGTTGDASETWQDFPDSGDAPALPAGMDTVTQS
jgi:hypothetical protein